MFYSWNRDRLMDVHVLHDYKTIRINYLQSCGPFLSLH
jgi:hypothetical protein